VGVRRHSHYACFCHVRPRAHPRAARARGRQVRRGVPPVRASELPGNGGEHRRSVAGAEAPRLAVVRGYGRVASRRAVPPVRGEAGGGRCGRRLEAAPEAVAGKGGPSTGLSMARHLLHGTRCSCVNPFMMRSTRLLLWLVLAMTLPLGACYVDAGPPPPGYGHPVGYRTYEWHNYRR
jgi:hypothetical protein